MMFMSALVGMDSKLAMGICGDEYAVFCKKFLQDLTKSRNVWCNIPLEQGGFAVNDGFNKKEFTEADIRTKFITPAIVDAGWNPMSQIREEYGITKGRIVARGKTCKREMPLKADYVLFYNQTSR